MNRINLLLVCLAVVVWWAVGVETGKRWCRSNYADRPPDAYPLHEPIPEIYRATWRDGELRT